MERGEVVDPPLRDGVGAARARPACGHDRDLVRGLDGWVLRPVDEAGEVSSVEVDEPGDVGREGCDRREQRGDRARDVEDDVFTRAVGPDPDVVRGARQAFERGELEIVDRGGVGVELLPQRHPEPDDDVGAARGDRGLAEVLERPDDVGRPDARSRVELEVAVRSGALGEDARLRGRHGSGVAQADRGRTRS